MPQAPEELVTLFAAAWMDRDGKALSELFHQDADFVNVVGLWWQSKRAIAKARDYGLKSLFKESVITAEQTKVKYLSGSSGKGSSGAVGEVATVHVQWRLEGQIEPDGSLSLPRTSIMMLVAQREDAGWRVAAAQNVDVAGNGMETLSTTADGLAAVNYRT